MLWVTLDRVEWDAARQAIDSHGYFTRVISSQIAKEGRQEVAFIATYEDGIAGIALATSGNKQGVKQRLVRISHFHEASINYEAIEALWDIEHDPLPPIYSDAERLSPARNDKFLQRLLEDHSHIRELLESLNSMVTSTSKRVADHSISEIETFERDAVGSALELWGGDTARKEIFAAATGQPTDDSAPFLSQLSQVRLREDAAINQDARVFPGFDLQNSYVVGAIELERFQERLTIVNCNRMRAEENLGVDLIYYSHRFSSFVMVQYKSLRDEGGKEHVYRPQNDRNIKKEIKAMNAVLSMIATGQDVSMQGFRLYNDPFFFKLCKSDVVDPLSTKMSYGIYIPLAIWDNTCKHAKGRHGATALTWDNCPRKMSKEEFVRNVRNGWIGSSPKSSEVLQRLVKDSLEGKKLLICAATSPVDVSPEQPRDDFGRYTTTDNPLATN